MNNIRVEVRINGKPEPGVSVGIGPRDIQGERKFAETNEYGVARFFLTNDMKYYVPGQGHWSIAVMDYASDVFNSAGWVAGNGKSLDLAYDVILEDDELIEKLSELEEALEEADKWLGESIDMVRALLSEQGA